MFVKLFLIYFFAGLLFFTGSLAHADRCDDMYVESCTKTTQAANDGTGLLGPNNTPEKKKALYDKIKTNLRRDFTKLLESDVVLRKFFSAAEFSRPLACRQSICEAISPAAKINYALEVFMMRYYNLLPPEDQSAVYSTPLPEAAPVSYENLNNLMNYPAVVDILAKSDKEFIDLGLPSFQKNYIKDTLFPKVKESAMKIIGRLPDGPQKTAMLAKIASVKIADADCMDAGARLMDPNAFYYEGLRTVKYCNGMAFATSSLYTEIFSIGHEVGHAIDPCNMAAESNAWAGLVSCLRQPTSIYARVENAPSSSTRCTDPWGDQIQESFADWFGTEVLSDLSGSLLLSMKNATPEVFGNGISNVMRPVCTNEVESGLIIHRTSFDSHPLDRDRVELLVTQPNIRQRLGCAPNQRKTYCNINGNNSNQQNGEANDAQQNSTER